MSNKIDQMIAEAQNNANATQQHQQANPQVVNNQEGYQQQANPQVINNQEGYQQPQNHVQQTQNQEGYQQAQNHVQQTQNQEGYQQAQNHVQQAQNHVQQPQNHVQQPQNHVQQPQNQVQQPQNHVQQHTPMAVNPQGNTAMDIPANLPPELAKYLGAREMTMETMGSSDLLVQDWVKTSYHGMTLGSAPQSILQPFQVEIDMTENSGYMLCQMVRWVVASPTGDQTNYVHTYDGEMGSDGQPWANAVMTAYRTTTDPKKPNVPYPSVQLPMKLTQDIVATAPDGQVTTIAQAGIMLGHTTAKTGWHNWQEFHNQVKQAGLLGQRVLVKVKNQAVAPKNLSFTWGVLEFELIGPAQ